MTLAKPRPRMRAATPIMASAPLLDGLAAIAAGGLLIASAAMPAHSGDEAGDRAEDRLAVETQAGVNDRLFGVYLGAPQHIPSNFHLKKPGQTDLTIKDVDWFTHPFENPVYYGARWMRFGESWQFGTMIDFTHSKAYSFDPAARADRYDPERVFEGTIHGQPAPAKAKVSDYFEKLEWTHGHNMLTYNALMRFLRFGVFQPYAGVGGGISLPHSEIQLKTDASRTYEYQYTGPCAQALLGIEWRLPAGSVFFEYKFTSAIYWGPLTGNDGSWFPLDMWRQVSRWWRGEEPRDGWAGAMLNSHQGIGGYMVRFKSN